MKKNLAARLGVLALVLTLVTSSLVSGTYSKYVSTSTGSDTARVAKFDFNLNDGTSTALQTATTNGSYKILTMAADTGVYTNSSGKNGVGADGKKLVAPGTTGSMTVAVNNMSEVAISVDFDVSESNTGNIPIYYTLGTASATSQRYSNVLIGSYTNVDNSSGTYGSFSNLKAAMAIAGIAPSDGINAVAKSYTLNWTWAFSSAGAAQTDDKDTIIGETGTDAYTLTIATTATQLDNYTA